MEIYFYIEMAILFTLILGIFYQMHLVKESDLKIMFLSNYFRNILKYWEELNLITSIIFENTSLSKFINYVVQNIL